MQARAVKTREKILASAIKLFAAKGASGATVDEIAADAGVNKQRIYAYFGSKSDLFDAALLAVFNDVELFSHTTLRRIEAEPDALTRILLQGFLDVHAAHPCLWRLLSWANLEDNHSLELLDPVRRDENQAIRQAFDRAVANGWLKALDFNSYLFTLLAVSYFYHSNRLTIVHTLGPGIAEPEWPRLLCAELDGAFRP